MTEPRTVTVTTVVAGGDGLAREDSGRVVFVPGAMPGETVEVALTQERRDFARGEVVRILDASPDRVDPPCPFVAAGCGGCEWQHIALDAQRRFKRDIVVDALRRNARIETPPVDDCVALPAERYRTTVRLGIDRDGRGGFRRSASHDLVVVDDCLVAHGDIAAQLADGRWPEEHEVVLRVTDRPTVAGRRFVVSPDSFFQIRTDGAEVLVDLVAAALQRHDASTVVDLYAGVGLFAATMHDRGFDVVAAVEGNPSAASDARHNLAHVCDVVEADVGKWPGTQVDAVIADPSRHGLDKSGVATVVHCNPRVVVLVSCDAAALGRDARLLGEAGYRLERSSPVDLFPHTAHIEVVSAFVKVSPKVGR
ncbi:MAG: TRAM domain-containing protein [Acidimicrobiales bacterium]|nr:TRAM domain-containing protein [Acidimicrobiales bacterium]